MKKYVTYVVCLCLATICIFTATSCSKQTESEFEILSEGSMTPVTPSMEEEERLEDQDSVEDNLDDDAKTSIKDALENKKMLPIYCMNDDGSDIESVQILIDENAEITAYIVTEMVVNEFSNHNLVIGIDDVTTDELGNVVVSFLKDMPPVVDVEEEVEYIILDCISQSILDNVKESNAVIFQIEGAAYESAHMSFAIDKPYDWR